MPSVPVVHEDARLIAVNKPAGALVVPGRGEGPREPLVETLSRAHGQKLFVVHRLDRGASGILVFAKDPDTHRFLSMAFERRAVKKTYLALVRGSVAADGAIDKPLRQFGSGRTAVDPRGKPSVTRYKIREKLDGATLLEAEPESGRRHQIRVHLYSIGHPIVGDRLYGNPPEAEGGVRLMLHAWRLRLPDPDGGARELAADPGPDFESVLRSYRPGP